MTYLEYFFLPLVSLSFSLWTVSADFKTVEVLTAFFSLPANWTCALSLLPGFLILEVSLEADIAPAAEILSVISSTFLSPLSFFAFGSYTRENLHVTM